MSDPSRVRKARAATRHADYDLAPQTSNLPARRDVTHDASDEAFSEAANARSQRNARRREQAQALRLQRAEALKAAISPPREVGASLRGVEAAQGMVNNAPVLSTTDEGERSPAQSEIIARAQRDTSIDPINQAVDNARVLLTGEEGRDDLSPAAGSRTGDEHSVPAILDDTTASAGEGAVDPALIEGGFSVRDINREHSLVLMGSKAVIVKQMADGPIDDRQRVLTVAAFLIWFSNRLTEHRDADGKVKKSSLGVIWLRSPGRRQYGGIEFYPDPANISGTPGYLNLWRGFAVAPVAKPDGYHIFRDHLLSNVCAGDRALFQWVFGFFAHIIQCPRERVGVALVLRGGMGSGKTVVGEHFGALFPSHYFPVDDPRYVTGQFNAHMASCLLLQADEAVWAGDKAAEGRLKGLVTAPTQQIEAKGVDPIRLANYLRLMMTSNESWVVPAGKDERRFAVLDVDPRCAGNHGYFKEMAIELANGGYAALLADLLAFDLSTINLRDIPKTRALLDQKERSLDSVQSWWLGRLVSGCSTRHSDGWEQRVRRDALFDDYIATADKVGIKRRREETIFGTEINKLILGLKTCRPEERTRDSSGVPKIERVRYYELPALDECRAAWHDTMQQTRSWPDESGLGARESETYDGRDC